MKIIVAQRHAANLRGIRSCVEAIDPVRAGEIVFTSSPEWVLSQIRNNEPAFVVSGQVFEGHMEGTDLARKVKRLNPKVLFFIYSIMPERNESVDGIIPKGMGTCTTGEHGLLASILVSNLESATPESIRKMLC